MGPQLATNLGGEDGWERGGFLWIRVGEDDREMGSEEDVLRAIGDSYITECS